MTAYLDGNFARDISDDECNECEGTDGDENDDPILQEACTLAGSDVIELEEDNGINLLAPALADLLHDKLTHDIFDHLSSSCHGTTSLPPLCPPLATSDCLCLHSASSASTLLLPPLLHSNSDAYLRSSYDYIMPTLRLTAD